jgi:hypothetical protein
MRKTAFLLLLLASTANAQTFRLYGIGGQSLANWHGQADVHAFAYEFEKPLTKRTEVGFVVAPYLVKQPVTWLGEGSEDVNAIHGALVVRHHFAIGANRVQPYVELGTGPMWAEKRVPAATSRFNFISEATIGFTILPEHRFAWIAGYRFLHISNGGYAPRNPGLNINAVVVGMRVRAR